MEHVGPYTRTWIEDSFPGGRWVKRGDEDAWLVASPLRPDSSPSFVLFPSRPDGGGGNAIDEARQEGFKISEVCKQLGIEDAFKGNGATKSAPSPTSPLGDERKAGATLDDIRALWEKSKPATAEHFYIKKKGLPFDDLRVTPGGWLCVPQFSIETGELVGIERIAPHEKRNKDDITKRQYGKRLGGVYTIGDTDDAKTIFVSEGLATGHALHRITGEPVIVAFSSGEFPKRAPALMKRWPDTEIVLCPDCDDAGISSAEKAVGASVLRIPDAMPKGTDWDDVLRDKGLDAAREMLCAAWDSRKECEGVVSEAEEAAKEVPSRRFHFIDIDDLDVRPPQWLVKGFLEKDLLGSFFGASESGKSFIAVDLALSVASEAPFAGHSVVSPWLVCYIAGEGASGIKNRIGAWCMARGIPRRGIPFVLSNQSADMLDAESVKAIIEETEAAAERHGVQPVLFVLDTLSRNFGAGDENSSQDMKSFIDALDTIRLSFPGCTVLTVHHSGHADKSRARGSTVFRAAMDTEYLVEKDGITIKLSNSKMKDAARQPDVFFEMEDVILGEEADGTPFGSAVLRKLDEAPQQMKKLTEIQQIALQAFRDAVDDFGQVDRLGRFQGVRVSDWQDVFCSMRDGKQDTKRRSFERASEALEERHYVKMENGMATFAGATAGVEATDAAERILSRKECEEESDADSDTRTISDKTDLSGTCPKLSKPGLYDNPDRHGQGYVIPLSCPGVRPEDRDIKTAVEEEKPSYMELLLKGGEHDADTKVS